MGWRMFSGRLVCGLGRERMVSRRMYILCASGGYVVDVSGSVEMGSFTSQVIGKLLRHGTYTGNILVNRSI